MADISEDMECLCHLMKTVGSLLDVVKARVSYDLASNHVLAVEFRLSVCLRVMQVSVRRQVEVNVMRLRHLRIDLY